jgi:hypothetical protein
MSSRSPPTCSEKTANNGPSNPSEKYQREEAMSRRRVGPFMACGTLRRAEG